MSDLDTNAMEPPSEDQVTLRGVIAVCAKFASIVSPPYSEAEQSALSDLDQTLKSLWLGAAAYAVGRRPDSLPDKDNAGYVKASDVLVPFYLLQDIPTDAALAALAALGTRLRVSDSGVICLSGSATLLGSVPFISDLDYCEYVEAAPLELSCGQLSARLSEHAFSCAPPLCQVIKVRFRDADRSFRTLAMECPQSWADLRSAEEALRTHLEGGIRRLKLDFVAKLEPFGVMEATNVVLIVDEDNRSSIVAESFAAQELPIRAVVLPRSLHDPIQLGRYVNFLIEDIDHYVDRLPSKALKRGLSLARVMLLSQWDDELDELLSEDAGAKRAAASAKKELLERLRARSTKDPSRHAAEELLRESLAREIELQAGETADDSSSEVYLAQVRRSLRGLVAEARRSIDAV